VADEQQTNEERPAPKLGKKPVGKWNAYEIVEQTNHCAELLALGWQPYQIRRECAERYGLAQRTAELRIAEARKQLAIDMAGVDRHELAATMLAELQNVVKFSSANNRGSDCIGALRLMAELCQLNPKT
jgi:hypothetical protein